MWEKYYKRVTYRSQFPRARSIRCESQWLGKAWAFWTQTRTVIFTKTKKKQKFRNLSSARLLLKSKAASEVTWLDFGRVPYCVVGLCAAQVACALRWRTVSGACWGRGYSPGCRGADRRGVKEAKTTAVSHTMTPVELTRKHVNPSEGIVIYTPRSRRMSPFMKWNFLKRKPMRCRFFRCLRMKKISTP